MKHFVLAIFRGSVRLSLAAVGLGVVFAAADIEVRSAFCTERSCSWLTVLLYVNVAIAAAAALVVTFFFLITVLVDRATEEDES